jgi:hypothetical protein
MEQTQQLDEILLFCDGCAPDPNVIATLSRAAGKVHVVATPTQSDTAWTRFAEALKIAPEATAIVFDDDLVYPSEYVAVMHAHHARCGVPVALGGVDTRGEHHWFGSKPPAADTPMWTLSLGTAVFELSTLDDIEQHSCADLLQGFGSESFIAYWWSTQKIVPVVPAGPRLRVTYDPEVAVDRRALYQVHGGSTNASSAALGRLSQLVGWPYLGRT